MNAIPDALPPTPEEVKRLIQEFGGTAPVSLQTIFTAAELQQRAFDPLRWAIPGILPEGAALLCGPPKIGKSRLVLGFAAAIACGAIALSHTEVAQGGVLVLALEDGPRRLQERLAGLLVHERSPWPEGLIFATEWPRLDEGGADALDAHLAAHPDTRLVIVDVLQVIRAPAKGKEAAYAADFAAARVFKTIADAHHVALLIVHHTRKMDANDPVSLVSGTNGLAGAVDSVLILQREPNGGDATLYLRGRDVEEAQFRLDYDRTTGAWAIAGDARAKPLTKTREDVVQVLERAWPGPMTPKAIATALRIDENTIHQRLHQMEGAEIVRRVGRGLYTLVDPPSDAAKDAKDAKDADASPEPVLLHPPKDAKECKDDTVATDAMDGADGEADPYFLSTASQDELRIEEPENPRQNGVFEADPSILSILSTSSQQTNRHETVTAEAKRIASLSIEERQRYRQEHGYTTAFALYEEAATIGLAL
jgi:hypothetical protein